MFLLVGRDWRLTCGGGGGGEEPLVVELVAAIVYVDVEKVHEGGELEQVALALDLVEQAEFDLQV